MKDEHIKILPCSFRGCSPLSDDTNGAKMFIIITVSRPYYFNVSILTNPWWGKVGTVTSLLQMGLEEKCTCLCLSKAKELRSVLLSLRN